MARTTPELTDLPTTASEESRRLLEVARQLIPGCRAYLGYEIAVTGSVARGIADRFSDIELSIWAERMPHQEERESTLLELGAENVRTIPHAAEPDGSVWTVCRVDDVWLEVGWRAKRPFDVLIQDITSGKVIEHSTLVIASAIEHCISLRTHGFVAGWKEQLGTYPPRLAQRIIAENTAAWSDPHTPMVRWALAERQDRMALSMRLLWDMQNLWQVLFALNERWAPDWKWIVDSARDLDLRPKDLETRTERIFTPVNPNESVRACLTLIDDTLSLAAERYNVTEAQHSIQAALRQPA